MKAQLVNRTFLLLGLLFVTSVTNAQKKSDPKKTIYLPIDTAFFQISPSDSLSMTYKPKWTAGVKLNDTFLFIGHTYPNKKYVIKSDIIFSSVADVIILMDKYRNYFDNKIQLLFLYQDGNKLRVYENVSWMFNEE